MVTPEMLLFLAGKMGLPNPKIEPLQSGMIAATVGGESFRLTYKPHTDDAQFGRLVVWAAMQGLSIRFEDWCVEVFGNGHAYYDVSHNSTPDSIRAAAVVAICRALGWEGENVPDA